MVLVDGLDVIVLPLTFPMARLWLPVAALKVPAGVSIALPGTSPAAHRADAMDDLPTRWWASFSRGHGRKKGIAVSGGVHCAPLGN